MLESTQQTAKQGNLHLWSALQIMFFIEYFSISFQRTKLHLDQMIYYSPKCTFLLTDQTFCILSCFLGFYSTSQDFLASVISWESHSVKPWIMKCYVLTSSAHYGCKWKAPSKWSRQKELMHSTNCIRKAKRTEHIWPWVLEHMVSVIVSDFLQDSRCLFLKQFKEM